MYLEDGTRKGTPLDAGQIAVGGLSRGRGGDAVSSSPFDFGAPRGWRGVSIALILYSLSRLDSLRSLVGGVGQHVLYGCDGDEQPPPDSDCWYLAAPGGFIRSGLADPEEFPARRRDGEDVLLLLTAARCPIGHVAILGRTGWLCSGIHSVKYSILTGGMGSAIIPMLVKASV